jgi:hypothetical protein
MSRLGQIRYRWNKSLDECTERSICREFLPGITSMAPDPALPTMHLDSAALFPHPMPARKRRAPAAPCRFDKR